MLSRVSQLDTTLLDNELFNILIKDPSPEVSLVVRGALLHLGLQTYNASYGARLQNLVYANLTRRTRWLLVLLATVPPYIHQKIRDKMLVNGWPDYPTPPSVLPWRFTSSSGVGQAIGVLFPKLSSTKARRNRELRRFAWDSLIRMEKLLAFSSLINFLCFLYNGRCVNP
jgi:peroxin-2